MRERRKRKERSDKRMSQSITDHRSQKERKREEWSSRDARWGATGLGKKERLASRCEWGEGTHDVDREGEGDHARACLSLRL